MAQQKQLKQLILTDNKNIFTYRFQPIQRLSPDFMTDDMKNVMYTKHSGDYTQLEEYSLSYRNDNVNNPFLWMIA